MPNPTICGAMDQATQIQQIADRAERLLVRHRELQRTNALLTEQVEHLTAERDSLKSRLAAARARIDALLERLPEGAPLSTPAPALAPRSDTQQDTP
jgi:cell division protein ZapB